MGFPRKSASITEIEEITNLAKNVLKLTESQIAERVGISQNLSTWRKAGKGPAWYPHAVRGLLAQLAPAENGKQDVIRTGMFFTTDQLETLNNALYNLSVGQNSSGRLHEIRAMRSVILLELASRLDN